MRLHFSVKVDNLDSNNKATSCYYADVTIDGDLVAVDYINAILRNKIDEAHMQ